MSLTVCVGLNLATSRVPSARRICTDVVGWEGSRGIEGGETVVAEVGVASGTACEPWGTSSGVMLWMERKGERERELCRLLR